MISEILRSKYGSAKAASGLDTDNPVVCQESFYFYTPMSFDEQLASRFCFEYVESWSKPH